MKLYAVGMMLIAQAGVAVAPGERSMMEYALTQGGLFAVALVLLYMNQQLQKQMTAKDEQKMSVLTDLVSSVLIALTKLEASNQQLARSLDTLEHRPPRH